MRIVVKIKKIAFGPHQRTSSAHLEEIRASWTQLGAVDPMWAVLTDPVKQGNLWKSEEFYQTGILEIDDLFKQLNAMNESVNLGAALDFGCGVGRLTAPLATHFRRVVGLDIAQTMLDRAKSLVNATNIEWVLNTKSDLQIFSNATFDFVYSNIVLQHMPVTLSLEYISEFLRVSRPNALIVFQLPEAAPWKWSRRVDVLLAPIVPRVLRPLLQFYRRLKYARLDPQLVDSFPERLIEMHGASVARVRHTIRAFGGTVVHEQETNDAGYGWRGVRYFVRKK
jgi:ubiquinone/menaquinone biosynthesis C-methylase UbiE